MRTKQANRTWVQLYKLDRLVWITWTKIILVHKKETTQTDSTRLKLNWWWRHHRAAQTVNPPTTLHQPETKRSITNVCFLIHGLVFSSLTLWRCRCRSVSSPLRERLKYINNHWTDKYKYKCCINKIEHNKPVDILISSIFGLWPHSCRSNDPQSLPTHTS